MNQLDSQRTQWTDLENEMLNEGVQKFGLKWQLIANFMKNRTPSQCAQRWKRIKQKIVIPFYVFLDWTKDDLAKLKIFVKEYGRNWQLVAEMLGNKTSRQVRDRYVNNLDPKIKSQSWTQQEDDILYQNFLIHGCKWTKIKQNLPSRSERMVKNRFYNHIRYTHLKLQNPYKMINNQINPYEEIQMHRQKMMESQTITASESFEQTNGLLEGDYSKFLNLNEDFSINYMNDI
ncbi:hypothetical protein pb186bvf_007846 [Paramecium bursaria]